MLTLPNVATQDGYTAACTLGPVATAQQIVFVVANAAVLVQIAPLNQSGTLGDWSDEILLTPQANVVQRAGGMRFRSAVAGVSAQIVAQLIEPADPVPGAGTPFTAKLASTGGVTPGTAAVEIQKDGANIASEPTLDFEVGLSGWTVVDDPANTRVKVTPPRLVVGAVDHLGNVLSGSGFTAARSGVGLYTVTFNVAFPTLCLPLPVPIEDVGTIPCGLIVTSATANIFSIQMFNTTTGAALDQGFFFLAFSRF